MERVWRYDPGTGAWDGTGEHPGCFLHQRPGLAGRHRALRGHGYRSLVLRPGYRDLDATPVAPCPPFPSGPWPGTAAGSTRALSATTSGTTTPGRVSGPPLAPTSTYNIPCLAWDGTAALRGDGRGRGLVLRSCRPPPGPTPPAGCRPTAVRLPGLGRQRALRGYGRPRRLVLRPGRSCLVRHLRRGTSPTSDPWPGTAPAHCMRRPERGESTATIPSTGKWFPTGGRASSIAMYALAWDGRSLYSGSDQQGVWRYGPDTWYLAEGSTDGGMETFVLVQNPGANDVHVDIAFQTDTGEEAPADLQGVTIPAYFPRHLQGQRLRHHLQRLHQGGSPTGRQTWSASGPCTATAATWAHDSIGTTDSRPRLVPGRGLHRRGDGDLRAGAEPGGRRTSDVEPDAFRPTPGEQAPPDPAGGNHSGRLPAAPSRSTTTSPPTTSPPRWQPTGEVVCERAMYGNDRAWAHDSVGVGRAGGRPGTWPKVQPTGAWRPGYWCRTPTASRLTSGWPSRPVPG